ncbi:PIG-L family deacetylase [Maribacter sp. 1_MG-2023]|uniref:PIG-L family deacetylase n=1 Tax=Maribacter sp. 1_MG-2023 TaxID=3062677 RepID=UPI0026E2C6D7|nr:PIG-L family deacetylase [Maribacter sp. 1_MG-2023]MDO6472372.1 PIG-L family deacetylase [Maribacter sp. 1_MG-2023]
MRNLLPILLTILLLSSCGNHEKKSIKNKISSNNGKTLMAIFAHPDDEIVISPILSKYQKEGVNIHLVIVTDGSKGVTPHANIPAGELLAEIRAEEALCVTKTLGINPPIFLSYIDGDLAQKENINSLDEKIDSLFTKYRPNTVISFGPGGQYGHPDHRIVSNVVTEVFQRETSESLQNLLYYGYPKEISNTNVNFNTDLVQWLNDNLKRTQKRFLTYRIPFNEEDLLLGHTASDCHKSQYIPEAIDDLIKIVGQADSVIYFRSWNGSNEIKNNIFD